jgi:putative transposase
MGRDPRPLVPDGIYHVMARGNDRKSIFDSPEDYRGFLGRLDTVVARRQWCCYAYCLMGNHFHLVLRTPLANVSDGMRDLLGGFARARNERSAKSGHVFGSRYRSVLIESDPQLISTILYVLNNPVRAGLSATPTQWLWSSAPALLGVASWPDFLDVRGCLEFFATDRRVAQTALGSLLRSAAAGPPPRSLRAILGRRPDTLAILDARAHGYSQRQIATALGLSEAAVSRRISRATTA